MNYTLDICGNKQIQNPSAADIQQAVLGLDSASDAAFLILGPTDLTYIQASGDQKVGFDLEYQDGDMRRHFRARREFTAEEIVKAMTSYALGSDDWKKAAEWEAIK